MKTAKAPVPGPMDPLFDALAEAVTSRVVALLKDRDLAPKAASPAAPGGEEEWLPPTKAAKLLNVAPKSLEAWRSKGSGPPFSRIGSRVRYSARDLDGWARSRSASSAKRST